MFALSAVMLVTGVGAGLDLVRVYNSQQKLTQVAALTCQYASTLAVQSLGLDNSTGQSTTASQTQLVSAVTSYLVASWTSQQQVGYPQTTPTPFTTTAGGPGNVTVSANVPTTFMRLVGVTSVPVAATSHCYDTPATPRASDQNLVQEGFESAPCGQGAVCYTSRAGNSSGSSSNGSGATSSVIGTTPSYVGSGGSKWYTTGYCLETDSVGFINATVPEGTQAAELDCDNGSGTAGNSAISTLVPLAVGNYELRYFYRSRVIYPNYDPTYICGSVAADTSWANDTTINPAWAPYIGTTSLRTNQINVYLDKQTTNTPPTHTTLDGKVQLAGSNMIDTCVYSYQWVERSVRIKVTTLGNYWLTFAADGANDSFGGQLDKIRLCEGTCTGTVQDNFPSAWLSGNNGGVNKLLFEDTFESPIYAPVYGLGSTVNPNGNLNLSTGTSGTLTSGWPTQSASGWATAATNQVQYWMRLSAQGAQSIQIPDIKKLFSRPFLLNPGYYEIKYNYVSNTQFPSANGTAAVGSASGPTYCAPQGQPNLMASSVATFVSQAAGSEVATYRNSTTAGNAGSLPHDSNFLGVFMSAAGLASTPVGGGSLGSTTSYTNPDGTVTTTAAVPPNGVSLSNYNAAQVNPMIDFCAYSTGWTTRTIDILIQKTGYYWLTFSALAPDGVGGAIDDVRLTALGSPAMASAPTTPFVIPAAATQPSATIAYTGFQIVADPLTFPAPQQ